MVFELMELGLTANELSNFNFMYKPSLSIFGQKFMMNNVGITKRKNADYTGGGDPFENFKAVSKYGVEPADGFITRMVDKISRIKTGLTKELQVKDESLRDTLADLANYAMLFDGYMKNITDLGEHAVSFYEEVAALMPADDQVINSNIVLHNAIQIHLQNASTEPINAHNNLLKIALNSLLIAYNIETKNMD